MREMTSNEAKEYWESRGGPAFPTVNPSSTQTGMTLRDYFAAQVLIGLIATCKEDRQSQLSNGVQGGLFEAKAAYQVADAMLQVREINVK